MTDVVGGVAVEVTADASNVPAQVEAAAQEAMTALNAEMRVGLAEAAAQLDLFGKNAQGALDLAGLTDAAARLDLFGENAQAALAPVTEEALGLAAAIDVARDAAAGYAAGGGAALDAALEANVVAAREAQTAMDEAFGVLGGAADRIPSISSGGLFSGMFSGLKSGAADAASFMSTALGGAFEAVANTARSQLTSAMDAAKSAAQGLAVVLVAGVAGGLYEGLKAANQFAKVQDTFTAITGSATQAQSIIVSLRQTALDTGQSFENISRFSQQLLAAGVQGVPEIANALAVYATAFGRNTQSMQRAATQLQEIQLKGTLQAQQLNALVRDGVPAYQAATVAAEKLGLAQKGAADEGTQVTDAMKAGKISAQAFFDALSDPSVISKASATVAALNTNIGFQMQKLQTELVHTFGQVFTPLFQTLGAAVEPITQAMARITLDAPGLKAVGDIIASLFNATVAKWAQDVGDGINYVATQLERLGKNQSVGDLTDKLTKLAPLAELVGGFVATIGAKGLASFVPFLDVGLNPVVGAFATLILSVGSVRDDIGILAGDAAKLAGVLGSQLTPALQGVQTFFDNFASGAMPFLQDIGPAIDQLGQALQSGNTQKISSAASLIGTSIGDAVTGAVQNAIYGLNWTTIGENLGKGSGTLVAAFEKIVVTAFNNIPWETLGREAGENGPKFFSGFFQTFFIAAGPAILEWATAGHGISLQGLAGAATGGELGPQGPLGQFFKGVMEGAFKWGLDNANLTGVSDIKSLGTRISTWLNDSLGSAFGDEGKKLAQDLINAIVQFPFQSQVFVFDPTAWFSSFFGNIDWKKIVGDMFSGLGKAIHDWLTSPAPDVQLGGSISGNDGQEYIDQNFGKPIDWGKIVGGWFSSLGSAVHQALGSAIGGIDVSGMFEGLAGGAARGAGTIVSSVARVFGELPGQFGSILGQAGQVIGQFVGQGIGQFAQLAGGAAQQVGAMAGAVFGGVAGMVGGVIGQFAQMVGSTIGQAAQMAGGVVQQVWAMAGQAWSAGSSFAQNVAAGIGSGVGSVMSAAGNLVHQAIAAAGNAVSGVENIGLQIAQGIAQGIGNGVNAVTSAAGNVVSQAIAAAQSAIHPGSPSKLTRDLVGLPLGQGIAVGLDQSVGQIEQSATAAVNAALVAMQGGYTTGGSTTGAVAAPAALGAGVSITNNAYGPDPASVIGELNRQQQFKLAALGVV